MKSKIVVLILVLSVLLSGCVNSEEKTVKIAQQFGLAYAPLQLAKELDLIEKHLPDYTVEWKQIMNTATIREGMLSSDLDIGFMGIPPFLIGYDKGMNWKIFRGLSKAPLGLTYNKDKISSLEEIDIKHKIALPQPGSIQHILLAMYLERETGTANALDDYLLTISHPDGQLALLSNSEVAAHFTSPPYIFEELKQDNVDFLVDGNEAFGGEFTFIVGVVRDKFNNQEAIDGINKGVDEAVEMIINDPGKAAEILTPIYGLDEETILSYLIWDGMDFNNEILGIEKFSGFMLRNDYIETEILEEDVLNEQ